MHKITFSCKVITPLFMYGRDRNQVELRSPEIKGMMRFWYRAVRAECNINSLREEEAQIFGGSGNNQGKSKVKVVVKEKQLMESCEYPLPHKKNFKKNAIKEGSTLDVILILNEKKYVEKIVSLFLLSTILGGFGMRSRRGFGSLQVQNCFGECNVLAWILELIDKINNKKNIKKFKIRLSIKIHVKQHVIPGSRKLK